MSLLFLISIVSPELLPTIEEWSLSEVYAIELLPSMELRESFYQRSSGDTILIGVPGTRSSEFGVPGTQY